MMIKLQSDQCDCINCCLEHIAKQKEASLKSASVETREINEVQYYVLKSTKQEEKDKKPYYISLMEQFGNV